MKSGKCPKCGGTEIYSNRDKVKKGYHSIIDFSALKNIMSETLVCGNCGFTEDYVYDKHLEKLKSKWKKI
jgi:predicted nucleic-acid-binding Zn-ribbon protein